MPKPINSSKASAPGVKCVLLVAQEDATRLTAKWALMDFGYLVDVSRCAEEALTLFDGRLYDVVVTADVMPGITGTELAHIIKLRSPRTPVVLLAGRAAPQDRSCLDAVLEKGAHAWGLTAALQELLADGGKDLRPIPQTNCRPSRRCEQGRRAARTEPPMGPSLLLD